MAHTSAIVILPPLLFCQSLQGACQQLQVQNLRLQNRSLMRT